MNTQQLNRWEKLQFIASFKAPATGRLSPIDASLWLADRYGVTVTERTVFNWLRRGLNGPDGRVFLGSVKIGGRIYTTKDDLIVFLKATGQEVKS